MSRPLALITGGTSGIGFASAIRLGASHDLALVYRSKQERAETAKSQLQRAHPQLDVRIYQTEFVDHLSCKNFYSALISDWPKEPEILIHSAGRGGKKIFVASDFFETQVTLGEHLIAAMLLTHQVLPSMYKNNREKIVFIGSAAAHEPVAGQSAYAAAKPP
jgi:short-subunit dehydrogenase